MGPVRTILVTGATGRQGGAVVTHLLREGFAVRALTRKPEGARARALASRGVELAGGDLGDRSSLDRALEGVHGVFGVQDFWEHGFETEVRHGTTLIDAAAAAGVDHFVYSSVAAADGDTGLAHFESKWRIERHLIASGLRATRLRPVFFMDLLADEKYPAWAMWGALAGSLRGGKRIQLIAVDDIGRTAARVFAAPERYAGLAIDLAGDQPTVSEMIAAHRRATGRRPRHLPLANWIIRATGREAAENFRWIGEHGWSVDVAAARRQDPELLTFEQWSRGRQEIQGEVAGRR